MTGVIERDTIWRLSVAVTISTAAIMLPDFVYASGTDTPIGNILCIVCTWATGSAGKGLATVAITIIGISALLGKVSWGTAITVCVGIALLFGASAVLDDFGITNLESGCNTSAAWPSFAVLPSPPSPGPSGPSGPAGPVPPTPPSSTP